MFEVRAVVVGGSRLAQNFTKSFPRGTSKSSTPLPLDPCFHASTSFFRCLALYSCASTHLTSFFHFSMPPSCASTPIMHPTTNLRVRNAHTSRTASPIRLSCPQCDRTFLSIRGRRQHIRAIHPLPTRNTNLGNVSLNREPSPSPPSSNPRSQTSSHSRSPNLSVDIPSPIGSGSPSLSDMSSSSFSHVFSSSTHPEQHGTPSTPSTRNYRATVEDITNDEGEDDINTSQRSPSSHSSYNYFYFGEEPSLRRSSSGRDTPSVHSSKPTIKRTYHPDLTGKFLFTLLSGLI